jgi:uncharacterized protein YbjT (DUF2867 family)
MERSRVVLHPRESRLVQGQNPINFVSAADVAGHVDLAVADAAMRGASIDVGGPEDLTMSDLVAMFQKLTGARGKVSHVPLPMMRMSVLMKALNPAMTGLIRAAVVMDTRGMTFAAGNGSTRFPSISREAWPMSS